jgi:ABC-2 type transport system ATP-binding protein
LGANGAGKTTTLNILLGFLKPDGGSAKLAGLSVKDDLKKIRKLTGYISENVILYPQLSGFENLRYFSALAGKKISKTEGEAILEKAGLQNEAHHKASRFYSKGMRQKVGIAIALAKEAKVLLLDEPASGLDPKAGDDLSKLLKEFAQEGGTVLMATHDIFRARQTCDRIGIMKEGKLLREFAAKDIEAAEIEQLYLNFMKQ